VVLPGEEPVPGPSVRVLRNEEGRIYGFYGYPENRFISRSEALNRVQYNPEVGQIQDSFGNEVGVGAFRLPLRGISIETENTVQVYNRITVDPGEFPVAPNQQLIERVTVMNKDGTLSTFEVSYGAGQAYDPTKGGGKWRYETSQALGLGEGDRATSSELRAAVRYREFVVRDISYK
jgi:hypothetical protein